MRRVIIGGTVALAMIAAGAPSSAGTSSANFSARITLSNPGARAGVCTSQTLSEQTGAVVRVVCRTGQFVSIGPRPGGRFIGTHGGAYTYYFGPLFGAVNRSGYGDFANGTGTIASFRVYSVEETEGPIHMLVSF